MTNFSKSQVLGRDCHLRKLKTDSEQNLFCRPYSGRLHTHWLMHQSFVTMTPQSWVKPVSHQPCTICDNKFLGFVRQPHSVVNNTARLPYEKQGCKTAVTNFRRVHFLCDLFAFSERRTTAAKHIRLLQDCCKTRKVFVRLTL